MTFTFRNLHVSPSDPVASWGVEGLLTALERGGISEWVRIVRAVRADPNGQVVAELAEALGSADAPGVVALFRRELARAKDPDRSEVVRRLRRAWRSSGMTQTQLAEAGGIPTSSLKSYLSGRRDPRAQVVARIERVAYHSAHRP